MEASKNKTGLQDGCILRLARMDECILRFEKEIQRRIHLWDDVRECLYPNAKVPAVVIQIPAELADKAFTINKSDMSFDVNVLDAEKAYLEGMVEMNNVLKKEAHDLIALLEQGNKPYEELVQFMTVASEHTQMRQGTYNPFVPEHLNLRLNSILDRALKKNPRII